MSLSAYRPEIDGLRTFAVIPVILFHMNFEWIPGGFLGVDVFFVISGYLIASILMNEMGDDRFSFRRFWARRIRRILPAMTVVTASSLAFAYLFCFTPDLPDIGMQAVASLLSFANIHFWSNTGDYWGPQAHESPFLHMWSLSVEEQFYLILPVVLFLTFRWGSRRLSQLMLLAIIASYSVFLYGATHWPSATFYLLPTRAWELATGCLLAIASSGKRVNYSDSSRFAPLAAFGLCMIASCYLLVHSLNGWLAVVVLGTALIIAFARSSGVFSAILTNRVAVHVGKLSYSLYLWHWPVLVYAELLGFEYSKATLFIPIYLLSLVSYYLVERPARARPRMVGPILGCAMVVLGFAVVLVSSPPVLDTTGFARPHWYGLYYDLKPRKDTGKVFEQIVGIMDVPERDTPRDAYRNGGIIVGVADTNPRVVVLGDSHGVMWSPAIRAATERIGLKTSFMTMNGVSPFIELPLSRTQAIVHLTPEEKYEFDKSRMELIQSWKPDIVIVCCRWSERKEATTTDLLKTLELHAKCVLLMEQPPELAFVGNRIALQYAIYRGIKPQVGVKQYFPITNAKRGQAGRELIRALAEKYQNCNYIPTYDLYVHDSQALILDGDNIMYVDGSHLTTHGALLAAPRIEQVLRETLERIRKR